MSTSFITNPNGLNNPKVFPTSNGFQFKYLETNRENEYLKSNSYENIILWSTPQSSVHTIIDASVGSITDFCLKDLVHVKTVSSTLTFNFNSINHASEIIRKLKTNNRGIPDYIDILDKAAIGCICTVKLPVLNTSASTWRLTSSVGNISTIGGNIDIIGGTSGVLNIDILNFDPVVNGNCKVNLRFTWNG